MNEEIIIKSVQNWVEKFIVELNLCPFAKREVVKNRVRYVTTEATTEEQLLAALAVELEFLGESTSVETTLLIHAHAGQLLFAVMFALSFILFVPFEEKGLIKARGDE